MTAPINTYKRYKKQNDYEGLCKLLQMRLCNDDIDLKFYQEAEKTLHKKEWQRFEDDIIKNLQTRIQKQQQKQKRQVGYFFPIDPSSERSILAEIYHYKQESSNLFEVIKDDINLLQKYESLLLSHYTSEYLDRYHKRIDELIAARGRANYQAAVPYAKTVKKIYTKSCPNQTNGERISPLYGSKTSDYEHFRKNLPTYKTSCSKAAGVLGVVIAFSLTSAHFFVLSVTN